MNRFLLEVKSEFIKVCFLCILLFYSGITNATNYFVDPSSDSSIENGNIITPWKSLTKLNQVMNSFKAGDSIFLKNGEIFFDKLIITCSGTKNAAIVFSSYGNSAIKPVFLFKNNKNDKEVDFNAITLLKCQYVVIEGLNITDDNIDPLDRSKMANISIAINIDSSSNIKIKNVDFSMVGVGVNIQGDRNLIDKCRFKNLRMIKNTVGGDDDYGANPVVVAGKSNTVSNCFFKDCWANSYDYTFDGGAIEIFGPNTDSTQILNNTAINCDGFMEIGSLAGGSCNDILVSHNTIINCGELLYISTAGKYQITVNNLQIFDNYIIHSVNQLTSPKSMIGMRSLQTNQGIIHLNNNIFWLTSGIDVARESQFLKGQMKHEKNIYYLPKGKLNFPINATEKIIADDSPISKKIILQYPALAEFSFFPYLYIIKFLYSLMF